MKGYLPRIVDQELDILTATSAAVSIEGARGVGKTETALQRAATVHRLDDPAQLDIFRADPSRVVAGKPLLLIDEWQRMPSSWDLVRRKVDEDPHTPRFILTGSAAPASAPAHTGAGRIITVPMRPLSLAERGLCEPTVSLGNLLSGHGNPISAQGSPNSANAQPISGHTNPISDHASPISGHTICDVATYADEIVRSGFPGLRHHTGRTLRSQLDGYIDRIVEHDIHELGRRVRNRDALRRWMTAYAAATSTSASFETIRDAASPGESEKPSTAATIPYRRALEGLWMIEGLPAWLPTRNQLRRVGSAPKHQMVDPAIAARLLGVSAEALLEGRENGWISQGRSSLMGVLFESLVALSVRVYAQACEARVMHLRTYGGEHEIDLIVARADGRVVALEVKLSATVSDRDTAHLHWLASRIGPDLLDAAIINTGREAYRRKDGVAVVPASLLTA